VVVTSTTAKGKGEGWDLRCREQIQRRVERVAALLGWKGLSHCCGGTGRNTHTHALSLFLSFSLSLSLSLSCSLVRSLALAFSLCTSSAIRTAGSATGAPLGGSTPSDTPAVLATGTGGRESPGPPTPDAKSRAPAQTSEAGQGTFPTLRGY